MLRAESMGKQTPRKQMHSTLTPDQQAMLQAAIGGTELKDRPVPYLTKQQRDELRAMVNDGFEMDAWREVERAFRIAMQKSYEKLTRTSRESAEHNARMAAFKAQAVAAQKQTTDKPPAAKKVQATPKPKPKGKLEAKKDTIRAILDDIKELDPEFSPETMPGQKTDFFMLCREHDPEKEFKTVVQSTFNDYLKGLCVFGRGARPTNYYREISPRIGVKRIKAA